jgi:DUF4097 and DUF4098 domain-containing protein YvlB
MKFTQLAICVLLMLGAMLGRPASAQDYDKSYTIAHRADIRITADESSVRVVTSDAKQVEFHVRSEGFATAQLGNQVHVDSRQDGDRIELTVQITAGITLGFNNRRVSTEVHMPRDADLLIETHDGAIHAASINGTITLRTKDGGIKASQLTGQIELRSADGGITADNLKGDCKLHTSDGTIGATHVDGKLTASTNDGTVRAEGRFDFLDLRSDDGSLRARIARGSKMTSAWNIRTKDGSVSVAVPPDLAANLDVGTRDGNIGVDVPVTMQGNSDRRHLQAALNGGGPVLSVHTEDGSIRVTGL